MKTCYIIGAGNFGDGRLTPLDRDLVIASDGGYEHCRKRGVKVDLVVGDFDSLGYQPIHPAVIKLNPEKDETDMGWAAMEGWKRGYREFVFYGGTGGRVSHTIANISLLADIAVKGGHGILVGNETWYRVIHNEEIYLGKEETGYLSVFCLGDQAVGVCEQGLKYGLDNAVLTKENPVGVSNEFIGLESRVSVRKGSLLLIREAMAGEETDKL